MGYGELINSMVAEGPMSVLNILEFITYKQLKYDFESLIECEEAINRVYPLGHKPLPTTTIPFGVILGETIVRNFNGIWEADKEEIWDVEVRIKISNGDFILRPFKRIWKFWNDRTDTFAALYKMIEYLTHAPDLSPEKTAMLEDENGWIHFPDGYKIRLIREGSPLIDETMQKEIDAMREQNEKTKK